MKKVFLLPLLLSSVLLIGCGKESITTHNETLVDLVSRCTTAQDLMREALDQENYTTAKTLHTTAIDTCKASQTDTAKLAGYDNDTTLRDATDNYLQTEIAYLEKLTEIFTYQQIEEFTPTQETAYLTLENELSALADTTKGTYTELIETQKTFADTHGYQLTTN
jgi:hypothetical protein